MTAQNKLFKLVAVKPLADTDLFPFGKHQGEQMCDVPVSYYTWFVRQTWAKDWPQVYDYVEKNADVMARRFQAEATDEDCVDW